MQQAELLLHQGNLQEAERLYRQVIGAGSREAIVYTNLAAICGMAGRIAEVPPLLQAALAIDPNQVDAHNNLGLAWMEQGEPQAAMGAYRRALELNPNHGQAHTNLAIALQQQGDLTAAIHHYDQAIRLNPGDPAPPYNRGVALQARGDLEAASASYRSALQLRPAYPEALINLGTALLKQGDLPGAAEAFETALQHNGDSAEARLNLAIVQLLSGDYQRGWQGYEWRARKLHNPSRPHASPRAERWDGRPLGRGDRLLVVSEQGLGDSLQFMRYVLPLRQRGVAVELAVPEKLHGLVRASGLHAQPLTPQEAEGWSAGPWIPMLSLPRHLQVSPANPVWSAPYLTSSPDRIAHWRTILAAAPRPLIGLNWQGNPQAEHTELRGRSLPLESFAPLVGRTPGTLISLQQGFGADQLERCSFRHRFADVQEQISASGDFLDTAAVVAHCDLVISSDTALAHLAGGLGQTTWLLLTDVPEWRWGLEGERSCWYPSMRLFRQRRRGHWDEVIERVGGALEAFAAALGSP